MTRDFENVEIIILSAGKGKRMQSDLPKVMHLLNGRPLIDYVAQVAEDLGVKPMVVVNAKDNLVKNFLGDRADYAVQTEQLGTGHAVMSAGPLSFPRRRESTVAARHSRSARHSRESGNLPQNVVVLYGDMPFIKSDSIKRLVAEHQKKNNTLTLMTVKVENFDGWRAQFADFSRVIRDADDKILRTVEKKDATPAELEINEINPAYFCFNSDWLWKNLKNLSNNNAQGEYYLTDLVEMALREGAPVSSIELDAKEAIGINTREHLETVNSKIKSQN